MQLALPGKCVSDVGPLLEVELGQAGNLVYNVLNVLLYNYGTGVINAASYLINWWLITVTIIRVGYEYEYDIQL